MKNKQLIDEIIAETIKISLGPLEDFKDMSANKTCLSIIVNLR